MNEKIEALGGIYVDDSTGRTVTEEDVRRVEELLGATLPEDYRAFLLRYGSSRFYFKKFVAFPFATVPDGHVAVDGFLGAVPLENFDCYDLMASLEEPHNASFFPKNILFIAFDGCGNCICLSVAGEDKGAVYFWNREETEHEDVVTYKDLQLVAPSFGEFIDKLEPGRNFENEE